MVKTPLDCWIAGKIGVPPEQLDRQAIDAYQLRRVQETLCFASANSPFYRHWLDGGLGRINSIDDLRRLPFTEATDLSDNPLRFLAASQSQISRIVTLLSSGTTGEVKRIFFTPADQEQTVDFFRAGMTALVSGGDRVLILLPGNRPGGVAALLAEGLGRLGVSSFVYGMVQDVRAVLRLISEEQITCLVGVPVQILALARRSLQCEMTSRLRTVLLSTDYVPAALKRQLQVIWGCEVFEHYGMTEMGFGGGVDCAAHAGYHLREADLLVEIIDPASGAPLEDGCEGEIVFTTLTRQGMPLIRYRTGDIARFLPGECPCGSVLKRLATVKGRRNGTVFLNGRPLVLSELDEALFALDGVIDFSVTIKHCADNTGLNLSVMVSELQDKQAAGITAALAAVPAIYAARQAGCLAENIVITPYRGFLLSLPEKRRIQEMKE